MSKPKYEDSTQIQRLRQRAKVLNCGIAWYKSFYRKRLNSEVAEERSQALRKIHEYLNIKNELNAIYTALALNNQLKKQFSKMNKLLKATKI